MYSDRLSALRAFVTQNGRLPKQREKSFDGAALGVWVNDQRAAYKRGELKAERVAGLEAVPEWKWSPREEGAPADTFSARLSSLEVSAGDPHWVGWCLLLWT